MLKFCDVMAYNHVGMKNFFGFVKRRTCQTILHGDHVQIESYCMPWQGFLCG